MDLARAAARLIEKKMRFSSGEKVECVISDTMIGCVADAAGCADQFEAAGVGVSLTVTPCWCYGTEVMDTDPLTSKVIWGFNGTERPGAVYLAAALAGYAQKGLPAFSIYGRHVQDAGDHSIPEDVREKYKRALAWVKTHCREGEDLNNQPSGRERKDREWEIVLKMTPIFRDLMIGHQKLTEIGFGKEAKGRNAIAGGFQGQRQWTDFYPNGDFAEVILNSSFDWNGIREAFVFATENDSLNAVAMLFGHLLSGTAQIFADVRTCWNPESVKRVTGEKPTGIAANGFIHLINSGSATLDATAQQKDARGNPVMKPFLEITSAEAEKCLENMRWCPANLGYFRGGGFSSQFRTAGQMPVTMSRVNLAKGLGPVLQLAEGWTIEMPERVHHVLDRRTDPTWPATWFVPRLNGKGPFRDVYSVMANWGANHGAISYGHIGADLLTLASMLRIPVCMHNLQEEQIFRPSAWGAFGMDPEGSDYPACRNLGPVYA
jgi:L-fucose isomerase